MNKLKEKLELLAYEKENKKIINKLAKTNGSNNFFKERANLIYEQMQNIRELLKK